MATFTKFLTSFDPVSKGLQFEHFVKWFLQNDPEWSTQVDQVWLWDDYPNRWGRDCGVDLVFKHKNGEIWAVQAKCYSPEYSITKADVDKFLSESNRNGIDKRLLIASTDQIGKNAKQVCDAQEKSVTHFFFSDFEKAAIEYPSDISKLNTARRKSRPSPRRHQIEAIDAVEAGFKDDDRIKGDATLMLLTSPKNCITTIEAAIR
jgi:predicted helicase